MQQVSFWIIGFAAVCLVAGSAHAKKLPALKVSENHRFLVTEDGKPFFWLGDTAWRLFYNATREEVEMYLRDRKAKGFNVIQAVGISWTPDENAYGEKPLVDDQWVKPNEPFWRHVDWVVRKCNEMGFYVGFLPTWGSWVKSMKKITVENAREYGRWLGERYRDADLVWILGGDEPAGGFEDVWREMATGLKEGDGGRHLITYHPRGWQSSAQWLHNEPWLDFNMIQSGHSKDSPSYMLIAQGYAMKPPKPIVDGEPNYEHIANYLDINRRKKGDVITAWDVRKKAYWDVFAGAFGHTYGADEVYYFWTPDRPEAPWGSEMSWKEALKLPGSTQVGYLKRLMLSRPFLVRVPDQSLIADGQREGAGHVQATRAADGSYAMVYIPDGHKVRVDLSKLSGERLVAWWFNPRDGKVYGRDGKESERPFSNFKRTERDRGFEPPTSGEGEDWVVVIDDAARGFGPPGK